MEKVRTTLCQYFNPNILVNVLLSVALVMTSLPVDTLAQGTPPARPDDVTAIQVSPTQVDVRWNVSGSSIAGGFRIERTNDPSSFNGSDSKGIARFTVGATTLSFSDNTVAAGNIYFYRVIAFNGALDSLPSDIAVVFVSDSPKTGLPIPNPGIKPSVSTEPPSGITQDMVVLGGSLNDTGSADKVLVYFEWGPDAKYGNIGEATVMVAAGTFSTKLHNLPPNNTYHYRAIAIGQGVGTGCGIDMTFTTPIY